MATTAQSWDYLAQAFKDRPLEVIVQYCITAGLSHRLFAFSSLDKLIIGIDRQLEIEKETLHIRFDEVEQVWHFQYHSTPFVNAGKLRKYPKADVVQQFREFIRLAGW